MRYLILVLLLTGCLEVKPPEPVSCINTETNEVISGLRKAQYGGSERTFIEFNDRNGIRRTITSDNSADWICANVTQTH